VEVSDDPVFPEMDFLGLEGFNETFHSKTKEEIKCGQRVKHFRL